MVNREEQIITSRFGLRKGFLSKHYGVDLRTREEETGKPQEIVAPEEIRILDIVYQEKWGYTVVARPLYTSYDELKFTHIIPSALIKESIVIETGSCIGSAAVTKYMKKKKYYEHLHFETWKDGKAIDPVKYFDLLNIKYKFKEE